MASISQMFEEIRIQQHNCNRSYRKNLAIVLHPKFYYGTAIQVESIEKPTLFGMGIVLSEKIKPNQFIIGEVFEVEETK